MIYELTILERLDDGSARNTNGSASLARDKIAALLSVLDVRILKHTYDGVKRLAYEIEDEQYAGYDYYEIEVDDDKGSLVCRLISTLLGGQTSWSDVVLRYLMVTMH